MSNAAHFEGAFKGWSFPDRDERVRRLAEIVNDYKLTAIHCSADVAAYAEIIAPMHTGGRSTYRRTTASKALRDPYFICFQSMIMAVCYELLEQDVSGRFEIIFDENVVIGPRVRAWYPVIRSFMEAQEQKVMPIDPIFRDDDEFVPLQCADLLAWLVRRELSGQVHSFDWIPNAMHGLTWSGHRQIFDAARLRGIRELSIKQSISDEVFERTNRLLGGVP